MAQDYQTRLRSLFDDSEPKQEEPEEKPKKQNIFDVINNICFDKQPEMLHDESVEYTPYIVNLALSHHIDTVTLANLMNEFWSIPKEAQHRFLFYGVRKRKRFAKWAKRLEDEADFKMVQAYFNYNDHRTKEIMRLLSAEDLALIRKRTDTGGKVGRKQKQQASQ